MSNLVEHAKRELRLLGEKPASEDPDGGPYIYDSVVEMIEVFSKVGHSGSSAAHTIFILNELLQYKNLKPLTDDPDEWMHVAEEQWGSPGGIWQNRRNGEAFSNDGGKTYYLLSEGGNDKHRKPLHVSDAAGNVYKEKN